MLLLYSQCLIKVRLANFYVDLVRSSLFLLFLVFLSLVLCLLQVDLMHHFIGLVIPPGPLNFGCTNILIKLSGCIEIAFYVELILLIFFLNVA